MTEHASTTLNSLAFRRYLNLVNTEECNETDTTKTIKHRRYSDVIGNDKQAMQFPRVRYLAEKYDKMINNQNVVSLRPGKSQEVISASVSVEKRRQLFENVPKTVRKPTMNSHDLLQPPTRKRRSLKRTPKLCAPVKRTLRRSFSDSQLYVPKMHIQHTGFHRSLSKLDCIKCRKTSLKKNSYPLSTACFDVWRQSSDMLDGVSCSVSPASLASPCESLEEIPILLKSISFEYFSSKCARSNSTDSAVVMDDFASFSSASSNESPSQQIYVGMRSKDLVRNTSVSTVNCGCKQADRKGRILFAENDKPNDLVKKDSDLQSLKSEESVILRNVPGRTLLPPSVVISDHTGATFVAVPSRNNAPQGLKDTSLLANFLGANYPIDYTICPRKVSDCSTCSSVSTVDMSGLPNYDNLHVDIEWNKRDSDCSSCLTGSDEEVDVMIAQASPPKHKKSSNWRKVRNVVQWTPFIQTYKRHKYPWVQLAGHQGNFKAGYRQGTILKKLCPAEVSALESLKADVLSPFVPEYLGLVESSDSEKYLQLQDLLSDFSNPCVMDIKMGVRTYLEEELAKARHKPKLRKDMYEKMTQIDKTAPTEAENRAKAVTKPRYMVWRETISSTATLGFRIEGVRRADGTSTKDFKTTRTREQVFSALSGFFEGYPHVLPLYMERLKTIQETLEKSSFFKSHELIGSSLLFVHNEEKAGIWLIDFAKTVPLPKNVKITHSSPWIEGTHEDGYLIGLKNLSEIVESVAQASVQKTINDQIEQINDDLLEDVLKPINKDITNGIHVSDSPSVCQTIAVEPILSCSDAS